MQSSSESWKKITSDRVIVNIVRNVHEIDSEGEPIIDYIPNVPSKQMKQK